MFPQLKRVNNESGVVLFIVLMTSIVIMIYSLSILTQSYNELSYAQQQIDQLTCDELRRGFLWNAYAAGGTQSFVTAVPINGRTYTLNVVSTVNAAGGNTWLVNCSYDTF